jgi:hypothetical protein
VAYSEPLANRIRHALSGVPDVEEQEKMGGVSFLVNGKVCVRAHRDGSMMVRCRPDLTDELLAQSGVKRFEMKGKTAMKGWLLVGAERARSDQDLDYWIGIAREAVQAVVA